MAPAPTTAHVGPAVIMVVGSEAAFEVWRRRISGTELGSRMAVVQRSSVGQADGLGGEKTATGARAKLPCGLTCDVDSVASAASGGSPWRIDLVLWNAITPAPSLAKSEEDDLEADLAFQHEGLGRADAVYYFWDTTSGAADVELPEGDEERIQFADRVILSASEALGDRERARVVAKMQAVVEDTPIAWAEEDDLTELLQPPTLVEDYDSEDDGLSTMSTDDEADDEAIDCWRPLPLLESDQGDCQSDSDTEVALRFGISEC